MGRHGTTFALISYLAARVWQLAILGSPLSYADTPMYRGPGQGWLEFGSVSLSGSTLRAWPVTLLYALAPSDKYRVLAQFVIATLCWAYCIHQVTRAIKNRPVGLIASLVLAILALTLGVSGWDAVLMSESLSLSLVALCFGALLSLTRHGPRLPTLLVALGAASLLALIRPVMIPLLGVVALMPCLDWFSRQRSGQSRPATTVTAASALVLAFASALYVWTYNANIDRTWGDWLSIPGLNGRVVSQYRVASASRLGPHLVQAMIDSGGPPCLGLAPPVDQDWFNSQRRNCPEGLAWVSERYVSFLALHFADNPSVAWRYFHDTLRDQSTLRPDGLPSLPSPVPRMLTVAFFHPTEGVTDADGRHRLTPSPEAEFPLADPLLWWSLGGVGLLLLCRWRLWRSPTGATSADDEGTPTAALKSGPDSVARVAVRSDPEPRLSTTVVCVLGVGYLGLFATALLSANDVSRVGLPATVLLRVALVMACAVAFERLLPAGPEGRPSPRGRLGASTRRAERPIIDIERVRGL